ncbi:DgyrCDS13515 [Dimorphilus gyrociliatus]|uniref:DgyrCDS13515 n=1 Tax=Dimorphilus gyrociliatus TaxID=2664684 RepID=A0A7I8WAY6_9ANNE|nr:DgyrCDS13515 [Dimorphilus gyrociliatus]
MPLWGKSEKSIKKKEEESRTNSNSPPPYSGAASQVQKPQLVFHCQKAQGSPTGIISGFSNVKELYQKIAEVYDDDMSNILFCTLNTHKVDMTRLLGGQIGLEDFIFAHMRGQPKEIEIDKSEDALGLTITDNGAGLAFIKRIKEGSIMSRLEPVMVGDHIEKIDGISMVHKRHFEVARALKEIPRGQRFKLRLVEPIKSGFSGIGFDKSGAKQNKKFGSGKATLRFKSNGKAEIEMEDDSAVLAREKINELMEKFLGINDGDLAQTIWDVGHDKDNPSDFASAIDDSELNMFNFTVDFKFDLWGAINDAKSGLLKKNKGPTEFNEQF